MIIIRLNTIGIRNSSERNPLHFPDAYVSGIVDDDEAGRSLEIRQQGTGLFLRCIPLRFIESAEF